MKKRFIITSLFTSLTLSVMTGVIFCNKTTIETNASSYPLLTVPTTIDLNDSSATTIRNYYGSLSSLSSTERRGTNLLKNLKPILKNNQRYLSYDANGTRIWQCYEITDRDWDKSPASSIGGYNSSTNTISGYSYGTSTSSKGSNPYIHSLYTNRDDDNQATAWDNHEQSNWGINREHVWPKSYGFESSWNNGGARGDLMHLMAGNGRVNGYHHNNYYYAYVDKNRTYEDAGNELYYLEGNLKGYSKTLGGQNPVFEPQDSDKGDIARSIFYMVARYNYYSGSDSDGIDAGNPNLELVNEVRRDSKYDSSTTVKGQMGVLQDLLEWNRLDPPDEYEIHRNNILFNSFTKNRNPFIDFPEWAEYIWGKSEEGTYSPTSTGYADPSNDLINKFSDEKYLESISLSNPKTNYYVGDEFVKPTVTATFSDSSTLDVTSETEFTGYNMSTQGTQTVNVSFTYEGVTKQNAYTITVSVRPSVDSVSVSPSSIELILNESTTAKLTANVVTSGGASNAVTWTSSNPSVATVDESGNVTAVSKGNVVITATSTFDSSKSGSCNVSVTDQEPSPTTSVTLDFTAQGYENGQAVESLTVGGATATLSKGTNTNGPKYYTSGTAVRCYGGNTITLSSSKTIIKATFTFGSGEGTNEITSNVGTFSSPIWAGSSNEIVFTIGGTNGNRRIRKIEVEFEGDTPTPEPSVISVNVEPSSLSLSVNSTSNLTAVVTVTADASKGVTWSSSDENIVSVDQTGIVTALSNGEATITATSTFDSSKYGSCNVTVSQYIPENTKETAFTTSQVIGYINSSVLNPDATYYVKGNYLRTATDYDAKYGNMSIFVSDGANEFEFYRMATSSARTFVVGEEVIVSGAGKNLLLYSSTYEFSGCSWISGGSEPSPTDEPEIIETNVSGFLTAENNKTQAYRITAKIKSWYKTNLDATKYGNFVLTDGTNDFVVYGATATSSSLSWQSTIYSFSNPQDFLSNSTTKDVEIGDYLTMKLIRNDYGSDKQGQGIVEEVIKFDDEIREWCGLFLTTVTCDNGVTPPLIEDWNAMKHIFDALPNVCKTALATYSDPALDRYDYIIGKYGTSDYENYIGRTISSAPSVNPINVISTSISTWLIISVSLVGITSIGGYFFYKKRREN